MSKIADYANAVADGAAHIPGMPTGPKECAMFQRVMLHQVGVDLYAMTNAYAVGRRRHANKPTELWATDVEAGGRERGLAVNDLMPGDLIFSNTVSHPYGHVACYLGNGKILHNSLYVGGHRLSGSVAVHPLSVFGRISTIVRLDQKNDQDKHDQGNHNAKPTNGDMPDAGSGGAGADTAPTSSEWTGGLNAFTTKAAAMQANAFGKATILGKELAEDPMWRFKVLYPNEDRAPGWWDTQDFGPVAGLVVIRRIEANEMEFAAPIAGPFSLMLKTAWDTLQKTLGHIAVKQGNSASYGAYLAPMVQMITDPDHYRWPLPGVEEIHVRMNASGDARGEVNLFIPDQMAAQAVHATLGMIQRWHNAMVEIWLPHVYRDPARLGEIGEERYIVEPSFVGVIEEVTASPWPSRISFRVIPQTAAQANRGMSDELMPDGTTRTIKTHWENAKICDILTDIAHDYGMVFLSGFSLGLSNIPQLNRTIDVYDSMSRPVTDVMKELICVYGGLQYKRVFGTELFGINSAGNNMKAVYIVYDPGAWNPLSGDFWKAEATSNLWQPLLSFIFGKGATNGLTGNMCVFYPSDLVEPERMSQWADMNTLFASPMSRFNPTGKLGGPLQKLVNAWIAATGNNPIGQSYDSGRISDLHVHLSEFVDGLLPGSVKGKTNKTFVRVYSVDEMSSRNPGESELANPLVGDTSGQGTMKASSQRLSADQAASIMQVNQQKDGQFILPTPTGDQTFNSSDEVFLYYASNNKSRPSMVIPGDSAPDAISFYPYTITLKVEATANVRIGMPTCLIGFPRLDGVWEISDIDYELTGDRQEMTVTLRTARDLFAY